MAPLRPSARETRSEQRWLAGLARDDHEPCRARTMRLLARTQCRAWRWRRLACAETARGVCVYAVLARAAVGKLPKEEGALDLAHANWIATMVRGLRSKIKDELEQGLEMGKHKACRDMCVDVLEAECAINGIIDSDKVIEFWASIIEGLFFYCFWGFLLPNNFTGALSINLMIFSRDLTLVTFNLKLLVMSL